MAVFVNLVCRWGAKAMLAARSLLGTLAYDKTFVEECGFHTHQFQIGIPARGHVSAIASNRFNLSYNICFALEWKSSHAMERVLSALQLRS
jgi:hypothetical protein